jgi:hypothetical protein
VRRLVQLHVQVNDMKVTINCKLSPIEEGALFWLGQRGKWLDVTITRRSPREFDIGIEGTYDGDDGYDYKRVSGPVQNGLVTEYQMSRVKRGYPEVRPRNFSAWLLLACLHEFWALGLIEAPHSDWSFIRDADPDENWATLHRIVQQHRCLPHGGGRCSTQSSAVN